jgi:hypothetical protein
LNLDRLHIAHAMLLAHAILQKQRIDRRRSKKRSRQKHREAGKTRGHFAREDTSQFVKKQPRFVPLKADEAQGRRRRDAMATTRSRWHK